ncbi:TonB-dependent receptor [Zhongshania aliphaticivorans]|uniref:TonB-dependent receptor n=1 Tax=Zhongshania aliphaticivorans TaxID=1470434 RepID=UPI0012E5C2FF|nr:TonB-dependent receptor [Zhongshania aliphaticivorans]CAA0105280.1 Pesticin receptor [Zhongshania aliphaticivorans]
MNPFITSKSLIWSACLVAANVSYAAGGAKSTNMEEMVVSSQFRDSSLLDLASTVSVFDGATISARGANNIEQLLNLAPNVNFSAGASRGRFFQIRGIGERSQFIDPVSPSVGLIIDGMDFSGLGLAASTLDIAQVEVLRGPQGTVYGANALAGLISMTSQAPTTEPMVKVSAEVAEYNSQTLAVVASGPLSERVGYRVAVQKQQSDGYIENTYLGKDDVNNIDESVLRGKLNFAASDDLQMDFTFLYLDADNGYDAFSLTNNRETQSDQPGTDAQETFAASMITRWSGSELFSLETVLSLANSETEYGYDEDWVYVGFHPDEYSSVDNYQRDKDNISADVRFISTDASALFNGSSSWVVGVYLRQEDEDLERNASFTSQFETENAAVYGQLRSSLSDKVDLVSGLRFEKRDADYSDSLLVNSNKDEDLWGGNLTLEYRYAENKLVYGTISRGYKAGGVNGRIISAAATNPDISSDMYEFDTEHMINYELGMKGSWLDSRLQAQVAVFYQDRSEVQAKQSIFDPNDFSFDDFLVNAAGGKTTGVEVELNYLASERLRFFAAAGLLNAEFDGFSSQSHVDAKDDINGGALAPVSLDGREVAHAPKYQFFVGSEVSLMANLILRVELEGKDEFYFSNSHNQKSTAYELVNTRLTYIGSNWDVSLWGRNLTDEDYETRGFYFSNAFGNNPANGYAPETYTQLGEPRVIGVSASYTF